MARVLARDVHITLPGKPHDPVVLRAGQAVPKEYAEFVTNPRAFTEVESEPSTPSAPASAPAKEEKQQATADKVKPVNYSKLKKTELEALATARGLDVSGTVKVLAERLAAADAAQADAGAGSGDSGADDEVDFDSMDEAALRAHAAEHNVDIADATSQEEIIALLENAQE